MKIVKARPGQDLSLGIQGENLARRIVFYIAEWVDLYGEGTVQLLVKRNGDEAPYPATIKQDGYVVSWDVTAADTAVAGRWNKYELRYYVGETLAKAALGQFVVAAAFVDDAVDPPEPQKGWVDQVLEAAMNAAESEENAAESESNAQQSEQAAKDAMNSAVEAARQAELSRQGAAASERSAGLSESNAADFAANAEQSAKEAKEAAEKAAQSESNAKTSETNAAASEQNAKTSEETAKTAAERAEAASQNAAWVEAEIDDNGHLIVSQSDNFLGAEFSINESGHLEVAYT